MLILNAALDNPIFPKMYSFKSSISTNQNIYSTTNNQNVNYSSNIVKNITSISMSSLPTAAGSKSIYMLKMPAKFLSNIVEIDFPFYYELNSNAKLSTYFSNSSVWDINLSYFDLLQQTYKS